MKRFDQINVIPFIDIMLVLLAIVLTTATFISQGRLDINLPQASTKQSAPESHQSVSLAIAGDETIYFQEIPVTLPILENRVSQLDENTKIVFKVDKTVPFQQFVHVIDLLKQQNIERLSIITKKSK